MSLKPLPTPLLRVSRPVAACSRCRIAKIKCDGKLPACTACEKTGKSAECTSTNDQFARGKERSYVSTLETRLDKLKARIEEAKGRKPSVVSLPDDESLDYSQQQQPPPPSAGSYLTAPHTTKKQKRKEASAIDDLVSDFGFLSVNATTRDFYGFTSAMTYARLILSACSKDPVPEGISTDLPPRYAVFGLIQFYFDNVFALLPVFDESTFYASVDKIYAQNPAAADSLDHCIVRLVLAIASASLSEQHGDQHYLNGIGHVSAALDHAEAVLHPGAISNVQVLVLLTEYAALAPHHFSSWQLIGAASRAMTDLGLHHDPPKGTAMSKGKLDLRRRVFYCVYVLDRGISTAQNRAFSFSDESVEVKVPFQKQASSAPTSPQEELASPRPWLQSYDLALDVIDLRLLQSSWYTELFQSGHLPWKDPYPYLWNTCDAMRSWFERLSPSIPPNIRTFFELELLNSCIRVLSTSPRVPVTLPFAKKLTFEYCIRYADLTVRVVSESGHAGPMNFYDALKMHHVGQQFKELLQSNTDLLLNGQIPPLPEVKPNTAPPPPMPPISIPQGESVQRFNLIRSMGCIHQIGESLRIFGIRWGFDSWHQNYQLETGKLVEDLNQRLRDIDEASGFRRQSVWQGSMSSVNSGNGSISYTSPQSMSTNRGSYPEGNPQAINASSFNGTNAPVNGAPQLLGAQPDFYAQQHAAPQHMQTFPHGQQMFMQPSGPSFDYTHSAHGQSQAMPSAPLQQFANWGGYTGAGPASNLLDEEEEEALPPETNPWDYENKG